MHKYVLVILALVFSIITSSFSLLEAKEQKPDITAASAVLVDRDSGRVIYKRNSDQERPMASTTKIMTALLALKKGSLDDIVVISERAAATGGSSIWLFPGEEKTLEELLYGLMLRSGNDAAVAIAEHIAGSVEAFAVMMTQKAKEIGASDTSFKNPHGLHYENHYTTAYDLALIAAYILKNPKFREIVATRNKVISWPGAEWERHLRNQNRLLDLYPGADGIKTGWTTPAGRCFVGSATRDGWQLITVVLNASDIYADSISLFEYGFGLYENRLLIRKEQFLQRVKVERGLPKNLRVLAKEDIFYPMEKLELEYVRYVFKIDDFFFAPIAKGEEIGELVLDLNGKRIGTTSLIAGEEVKRAPLYLQMIRHFRRLFV